MANTTNELRTYPLYDENTDDPDVIRSQIARTRAQMTETVDQIQARLAPDNLKQQAREAVRDATLGKVEEMTMTVERKARGWRSGLVNTIRENPVPAALVGIGLGWLLMSPKEEENGYSVHNGEGGRPYNGGTYGSYTQYYGTPSHRQEPGQMEAVRTRAGEAVGSAQEYVGDVAGQVQERAGEVQERASGMVQDVRQQVGQTAENIGEQASNLTRQAHASAEEMRFQARMGAYRAKRTFSDTLEENPIAVGVAALAAGAIVGLVLPSTPIENEWMGEKRDEVMEEAKTIARDTADKVQHVAQEARQAARETARTVAEQEWATSNEGSDTGTSNYGTMSSS